MFLIDAERVHDFFITTGAFLGKYKFTRLIFSGIFDYRNSKLENKIFGLKFRSPVGLAAGFDYDGKITQILPKLGFGFASIGTVTNYASEGNPPPHYKRLIKSKSIWVNKGFKNSGIREVMEKKIALPKDGGFQIGLSIGATNSKDIASPKSQINDIVKSFSYIKNNKNLAYLELNVSCPNVAGAGTLAKPGELRKVLSDIRKLGIKKPLFIKFPIEIEWKEAKKLIEIMIEYKVKGIIIGNLAKNRDNKFLDKTEIKNIGKGNFSGVPTFELSNELIKRTYQEFGDKITIIGVGGIMNAEDAYKKIRLGASLVQLITGMIFEGPQLINQINYGINQLLEKDGFNYISEAIGCDAKMNK